MLRHTLAALALTSIVGCSASTSFQPFAGNSDERAHLAAYAATSRYPADVKPSNDLQAAALINPRSNSVKIVNFSDVEMRDVNVWVNGSFIHRVSIVPSHGAVDLDRGQFYDSAGESMTKVNSIPNRVEIQAGDHLYHVGKVITE